MALWVSADERLGEDDEFRSATVGVRNEVAELLDRRRSIERDRPGLYDRSDHRRARSNDDRTLPDADHLLDGTTEGLWLLVE